jgi:hypothetical protein
VNVRYAAAFALGLLAACAGPSVKTAQSTGWQIMHPPRAAGQPSGTFDETAPLSKWVGAPAGIDPYPSQKACEQMIENWREGSSHLLCLSLPCSEDFHNSDEEVQRVAKQAAKNVDMLRCVSINDPRLKEK